MLPECLGREWPTCWHRDTVGGSLAGDCAEAVGDVQELAQFVAGPGKLVRVLVAGRGSGRTGGGGLTRQFAVAQVGGEAQQLHVSGAALHALLA